MASLVQNTEWKLKVNFKIIMNKLKQKTKKKHSRDHDGSPPVGNILAGCYY